MAIAEFLDAKKTYDAELGALGKVYAAIDSDWYDVTAYNDVLQILRNMDGVQVDMAHHLKGRMADAVRRAKDEGKSWVIDNLYELNRKILCYCAPECFDDYVQYMEIDRPYEKKFYLPRRKQLRPLAEDMERLERRELEFLAISLPPGVGKTTLAEFFLTWTGGRHPELSILTGSHSNSFLRGMYGEILRMLDPIGEYKWREVFPRLRVINTNAQDMMIDLGETARDGKRFATYEFSSIGSGNAGKVRASNLLYADDLVSSLEESLSRERMDKLYQTYSTDLRQRMLGSAVQLMIGTRWSVHDVIGRLEQMYADNPKAKFVVCPALDENDESLFDYPIPAGYTTKFLHEQREGMDDLSWRALYMGQPVEREGQLYPEDELRRYYELPDAEPDAILAVCDTKDQGSDYCVLPIAYQYGQDYYIDGVVCDNSSPTVVEARLVSALLKYNVHMAQFESNSAGGKVAEKVQREVKEKGGRTKIVTKYTTANKTTKIIVAQPFVLEHFLFKDKSVIKSDKEYKLFLSMLCGYTMVGRNAHDDVPDAIAMLANYVQTFGSMKAVALISPFK